MRESIGISKALGIHLNMDTVKICLNIFREVYVRWFKNLRAGSKKSKKFEGTGRINRVTMDLIWKQLRKSKETKKRVTLRTALQMAFMAKLLMTSNQPT